MASYARRFIQRGVRLVGGCCGTTPAHIAAIAGAISAVRPRKKPDIVPRLRLSGLEPLTFGPDTLFVNVGERTNVTGSAAFARLVEAYLDELDDGATVQCVALSAGAVDDALHAATTSA